jgi:hypothetical protein
MIRAPLSSYERMRGVRKKSRFWRAPEAEPRTWEAKTGQKKIMREDERISATERGNLWIPRTAAKVSSRRLKRDVGRDQPPTIRLGVFTACDVHSLVDMGKFAYHYFCFISVWDLVNFSSLPCTRSCRAISPRWAHDGVRSRRTFKCRPKIERKIEYSIEGAASI